MLKRHGKSAAAIKQIVRHKMPVKSVSQKRRETVEQTDKPENVWHHKASNALERAKMHFDSSCTIVRNQAKIIFDKMDHLSGHSSAGYAAVAMIKILAIFFLIIVVVECIFNFRSYFWLLCGYMCSLLYFAVVIVVRGANMILVSAWAIFKYVFFSIGKMLLASTRISIYYLRSSMIFALNGPVTIEIPTRWTLNLSIDWRSFFELLCLYGAVRMVYFWIKYGTRSLNHKPVSSAVKGAKRHFYTVSTICTNYAKIIHDKLDRLSQHSLAGLAATAAIKICVMFVVTAVVVKCVWIMLGYLSTRSIQLLYDAAMFIIKGKRMLMNHMSASFENLLISFWKTYKGSTIANSSCYLISIMQICILCGALNTLCSKTLNKYRGTIQQAVSFWNGFYHSAATPAKKCLCSLSTALNIQSRLIQIKIDRLIGHSSAINAIVKVIKTVAILFMLRSFNYFLHLVVAYIIRVPSIIWENVVAILEYVRNANSEIFLALTKLAFKCLTSISSLSSNCCTVTYYQINLISNSVVSLTNSWNSILLVCFLFGVLMLVLLLRATAFTSNLLEGNVLAVEW